MLGNPIKSSFRTFLSSGFIFPQVQDMFTVVTRNNDFFFDNITDYMNSTIVNGIMPGLTDPGSSEQIAHLGTRSRTYSSTLTPNRATDKQMTLRFQLKDGYLNWAILYAQFYLYLSRDKDNDKIPVFMGDIFHHVLDEQDNIVLELIYKESRIAKIPPIEFDKNYSSGDAEVFPVDFVFNDLVINYKGLNTIDFTSLQTQRRER